MRIHVGKKAPKGFVELPGAIHLGKGIWMMRIESESAGDLSNLAKNYLLAKSVRKAKKFRRVDREGVKK